MMLYRTDSHNNPAAFTTDVALEAGLVPGRDFTVGSAFPPPSKLITAKLNGDPVAVTIQVIDKIGYYTRTGAQRWAYIGLPRFIWDAMSYEQKRDIVGFHYQHEGGFSLRNLFPNYGKA